MCREGRGQLGKVKGSHRGRARRVLWVQRMGTGQVWRAGHRLAVGHPVGPGEASGTHTEKSCGVGSHHAAAGTNVGAVIQQDIGLARSRLKAGWAASREFLPLHRKEAGHPGTELVGQL